MADRDRTLPCLDTDANFEGRRSGLVWQVMKPDRYPHCIWPVTSPADIADALSYARSRGLRISIVAGGHSYIGHGVQDGTLVLDLSGLTGMAVDAENRCGWVEPGVRVAEFDAMLERAGLAFPIGHDPDVGLVGYLLGGGMGWNPDQWNSMACFNVTAAEIVLASGQQVIADADHNADLFWAVRGAGPNFCGIVTRLHMQLFARPSVILKSDYVFSLDGLEGVLAGLARMQEKLDEGIELSLSFAAGQCTVSLIVFAETEAEAARLGAGCGTVLPRAELIACQEMQPRTFAMLLDEAKGDATLRRSVESLWTDDPISCARIIADACAPSADSIVYIGFRKHRDPPADAACSILERGFVFIDAAWRNPAEDAANGDWVDALLGRLRPYDKGGYVNETDWDRHPERIAKCYSPEAMRRLKDINRRYDPTGMIVTPFHRLPECR